MSCAREEVDPPKELEALIFPWLDEEIRKLESNPTNYRKYVTTKNFFALLKYIRKIILQVTVSVIIFIALMIIHFFLDIMCNSSEVRIVHQQASIYRS